MTKKNLNVGQVYYYNFSHYDNPSLIMTDYVVITEITENIKNNKNIINYRVFRGEKIDNTLFIEITGDILRPQDKEKMFKNGVVGYIDKYFQIVENGINAFGSNFAILKKIDNSKLIAFNQAFITMQNRASDLYKSKHNGKVDLVETDKLILERLIYGKEVDEIEELEKVVRKIKKEMKEIL